MKVPLPPNDAIITGIKDAHQFMKILVIVANVNSKLLPAEAYDHETLWNLLALSKSGGIIFNEEKVKNGKITSIHFANISSVDIFEIREQLRKKANNLLNVEINRCYGGKKDDSAGSLGADEGKPETEGTAVQD